MSNTILLTFTNVKLHPGKKSYDYSAELLTSITSPPTRLGEVQVKAGTEGKVVTFPDIVDLPVVLTQSSNNSTISIPFILNNKKTVSDVKKYEKSQDDVPLCVTSVLVAKSYSVVFGEVGSVSFDCSAITQQQKEANERKRAADEAFSKNSTILKNEEQTVQRPLILQEEQSSRQNIINLRQSMTPISKVTNAATPSNNNNNKSLPISSSSYPPAQPQTQRAENNNNDDQTPLHQKQKDSSPSSMTAAALKPTTTTSSAAATVTPRKDQNQSATPPSLSSYNNNNNNTLNQQHQHQQPVTSLSPVVTMVSSTHQQTRKTATEILMDKLQLAEEPFQRDTVDVNERSAFAIFKAAANADRKKAMRAEQIRVASSPKKKAPGTLLSPFQVVEKQEFATREKLLSDERMAFGFIKSSAGGSASKNLRQQQDASTSTPTTSSTRRTNNNNVVVGGGGSFSSTATVSPSRGGIRLKDSDIVMIGGQMISPNRHLLVAPRQQQQQRQQNLHQSPTSPSRSVRVLSASSSSPRRPASSSSKHRQQQQDDDDSSIHHHHQHHHLRDRRATESAWDRLLHRTRYAPRMSERELVNLKWITLRDLITNELQFTDRDDVIDIYECWREKNQEREREQQQQQRQRSKSNSNSVNNKYYSSDSIQRRQQHQQQQQQQEQQQFALYEYNPSNEMIARAAAASRRTSPMRNGVMNNRSVSPTMNNHSPSLSSSVLIPIINGNQNNQNNQSPRFYNNNDFRSAATIMMSPHPSLNQSHTAIQLHHTTALEMMKHAALFGDGSVSPPSSSAINRASSSSASRSRKMRF